MSNGTKALRTHLLHWRPSFRHLLRASLLAILVISVAHVQPTTSALQQIHERGTLVVTGVSGPTTFYKTANGTQGLQYELARLFAEELGVKLVMMDATNSNGVLRALKHDSTDLAITGLASDDARLNRLRTAPPYMEVDEQLIQRLDRPLPASFDSLENARIGTIAGSSEAQRLKALTRWRPDLTVVEFNNLDPMDLLQRLDERELDYVAMNSNEFDARRALFPQVGVALNLQENSELAWALVKTHDKSLFNAAQAFLARKQADGTLDRLVAFYGQGTTFDPYSIRSFQRDIATRLPRYQPHFEKSAQKQGLDWRLLAAIAYQESHWQPNAVSPTGVQGIMMLTNDTASHFGIADRTNVPESIRGGATYYRMISNNLPASVHEPDRTWMALAGYNMGPAHIDRARKLAQRAGDDADKWLVVSQYLRQMAQEARRNGRNIPVGQALLYVQQVRRYYDSLLMISTPRDERVGSINTAQIRQIH